MFYIAGTEEELLKKGVVVKEGKKFLFFGGKQLHPARSLDSSVFTAVDKTTMTTIALPADREYKVVSRQDLAFADTTTVGTASCGDSSISASRRSSGQGRSI